MNKIYNRLSVALLSLSVITGCNSSINQTSSIKDFNNVAVATMNIENTVSKKTDYHKQDFSIKMDQFSPVPKKGMKWTYDLSRVYSNVANSLKIEISIVNEDKESLDVNVNSMPITINKAKFWSILNLVLINEYHNDNFAWYNVPGHPNNDNIQNGSYILYRKCSSIDSCGGFEAEVPAGKFIVEHISVQEYANLLDPNSGNNTLSWDFPHFKINKKVGLVEMKLQTPNQPNLGVTTLKLIKTNIK